jgi:alpha-glucosidase (family GH31 glycosyl hydrolase)
MKGYLRLRHQLAPSLHTMNHRRAAQDGLPLVQPMYYEHSGEDTAYKVPNQYLFGTELMVCPIASPQNTTLNLGKARAWLPDRICIDFFTGMIYRGDGTMYLYRRPEHIPPWPWQEPSSHSRTKVKQPTERPTPPA